jgi:hypothetical protein
LTAFAFFFAIDSCAMVTSRSKGTNSKERTDDDAAARFRLFFSLSLGSCLSSDLA